jgi:hypothetical protein
LAQFSPVLRQGIRGEASRKATESGRMKVCPACRQLNTLSRLSCMLCAAKFSVQHTAELLQDRNTSVVSNLMSSTQVVVCKSSFALSVQETPEYAELETALEETSSSANDLMPDVSTISFKMLPLDAQIQVLSNC